MNVDFKVKNLLKVFLSKFKVKAEVVFNNESVNAEEDLRITRTINQKVKE